MSFLRLPARAILSRPSPISTYNNVHVLRQNLSTTAARTLASDRVRIIEVGPRDGLQNEQRSIAPEIKTELVRRLAGTGLRTIEAGSFVAPKWVPQVGHLLFYCSNLLC